jgi:outer membrane protein OmpA-like peptidoglycan-associated protein
MIQSGFISYSHRDAELKAEFARHLEALRLAELVKFWHDSFLEPGEHLDASIQSQLAASDLVLLLLSSDFLASGYCVENEMIRSFERAAAGQARVVPIVLRPCQWKIVKIPEGRLGDIVALPADGHPVSSFASRDQAWDQITSALANMLTADEARRPPINIVLTRQAPIESRAFEMNAYFQYGEAGLSDGGAQVVRQFAFRAVVGGTSTLIGHCDAAEDSDDLSKRRAKEVGEMLERNGVPANSIKVEWVGKAKPAVKSADREALNRRVQMTWTPT